MRITNTPFATSVFLATISAFFISCSGTKDEFDATGTFESVETIISAEVAGRLDSFAVEEGQTVAAGQLVGTIDTTQLSLKKHQIQAQIDALLTRRPESNVQMASLNEQIRSAIRERDRVERLLRSDAATQKQVDDATTQVNVLTRQLDALRSSLATTTSGLESETRPLLSQISQINDQLTKSKIIVPLNGLVLTSYAEQFEMTGPGKPLFKMADVSTMILRAYVTGDQFSQIKLGQNVQVLVDKGANDYTTYKGTITWLSSKAEFTPKTIQTKDERANLVYAIKISVPNDGKIKIGMYGEVRF
ncbi:MAG TPA: HlyD family efflux transporter periplasmic adaptor subunit [Candidatus Didemnitutus sp.]|nr:HlyD family efflux transporter periplasmic adaptor subunit [Candidatus Didemnitutus sp.]